MFQASELHEMTGAKVSIKVEYSGGKNTNFNWEYSSPFEVQRVGTTNESTLTNDSNNNNNCLNTIPTPLTTEAQYSIASMFEEHFNSFAAKVTEQIEKTVTKCVNDKVISKTQSRTSLLFK